ncbi:MULTISPECIES: hypothetical protein [unclassified Mycoplasma]|uniref:hypothetical protein n=1 Tax=unclassified Mycoplasma TaxID=2683645 RepID=UPI000FDEAD81
MKWLKVIKILAFPRLKKAARQEYQPFLNQSPMEDMLVVSHTLHRQTYQWLRKFKTPQYGRMWLLRKKKAFNTLFFQQPYDVVVCDRYGNVLATFVALGSGYVSNYYRAGYFIYFMVVGSIKFYDIRPSDRLTFKRLLPSLQILQDLMGLK